MSGLPKRGPGRPPGSPNKITADIRSAILNAFQKVGGEEYLVVQARQNPVAFMTLLGKVLPMQVAGEGGGPLRIVIEERVVDPRGDDRD